MPLSGPVSGLAKAFGPDTNPRKDGGFSDLFVAHAVTTPFRGSAVPLGEIGGGREPPLFASRIGTAVWRNLHLRSAPRGGAPVSMIPGGKARTMGMAYK